MSAVTIIDMQKGCGATILSAELKSDFWGWRAEERNGRKMRSAFLMRFNSNKRSAASVHVADIDGISRKNHEGAEAWSLGDWNSSSFRESSRPKQLDRIREQ